MSQPTLLAVAHGSRNPAAADVVRAIASKVRRLAPVLEVRLAFLGHARPSLTEELAAAGSDTVIVPLLLSVGYHLVADIAASASAAGVRVAAPLGPDQLLGTALAARLREAGAPEGTPVVLAAAGSSDPAAAAQVYRQAELLADVIKAPVVAAFAATGRPADAGANAAGPAVADADAAGTAVAEAVCVLRASAGRPVAVASYLMAYGYFQDRLLSSGADWVTAPLGGHPAVAALVIDRYRVARAPAERQLPPPVSLTRRTERKSRSAPADPTRSRTSSGRRSSPEPR